MTSAFAGYDESYPPEILRGYTPPAPVGAARRATATTEQTFAVTEGAPGAYDPEPEPGDRPRTLEELGERTRLASVTPWASGSFIHYGNGKRAHWSGDSWHSHESPGYPEEASGQESKAPVADAEETVEAADDEPEPRGPGRLGYRPA